MPRSEPDESFLIRLRHALDTLFDESELNTLCFELNIDYEGLPGKSKADKARELVKYCRRRNLIPELTEAVNKERPDWEKQLDWPSEGSTKPFPSHTRTVWYWAIVGLGGILFAVLGLFLGNLFPLIKRPHIAFASLAYCVNDGPARVLDLRNYSDSGIAISTGDKLTLSEFWYWADRSGTGKNTVNVEMYLVKEDIDWDGGYITEPMLIAEGRHSIADFPGYGWVITEDTREVRIVLVQDQEEVVEELYIPLSIDGGSDLVLLDDVRAEASIFAHSRPDPANLVKYLDMETSIEGWEDMIRFDAHWENPEILKRSAIPAPTGECGAGYDLHLEADVWQNYVVKYTYPVQADVIVARVYLPSTPSLEENWVGLQAIDGNTGLLLARSARTIPFGEWTQMVLDLRGKYDPSDVALNERPFNLEVFYAVKGESEDTIRARLDDIAWYKDVGVVAGTRLEQRGIDRLLFDFEDDHLGGWTIASNRTPTDTIELSFEQPHRGSRSLRWETQLTSGDTSSLTTIWHGFAPQGGWIASVYLPDDVPTGTSVWANFYTYSESGWENSAPVALTGGMWNTLVWDTHKVDWGTRGDIAIGIEIGAEEGPYQGAIYIDEIQVFGR